MPCGHHSSRVCMPAPGTGCWHLSLTVACWVCVRVGWQGRGQLNYSDTVVPAVSHALFVQFVQGKGTVWYGSGK
jgi:hypothetical protein